jgi:mono/diheme cytochrome c family protein
MRAHAVLIVLLVLTLFILVGLHWVVLPDPSRRNYQFLPNMVESVPRGAQSPQTIRDEHARPDYRPAPGSIARGFAPFSYPATPEGALLAGQQLQNPIGSDDREATDRGAFVFNTFCSTCHGAGGRGDGTVTKRGVPPPPSLLLDHAVKMTDGQMYHLITLGQGNMASYASQVERLDRWRAIRYIRTLQAATLTAQAAPSPESASTPLPVERP